MADINPSVRLERAGDVVLLVVDNPPVNALSHNVRKGLLEGLISAEESDAKAIVLICKGRTFIAGADISEFSTGLKEPGIEPVQAALENCSKPVISAIHGTALGGGLEVALCTHFRVAVASAKFGLPEVNLGILPGAGGTQRLPRVTGVEMALQMVTSGRPIGTTEALACGLIDEVVDDVERAPIAFAERVVAEGRPLVRIRDRNEKLQGVDKSVFDEIRKSIARRTRGFKAHENNIRAIEAAVELDFENGLEREKELFFELFNDSQAKAQQYYFFAERASSKIDGMPKDTPQLDIQSCGVLGAGTMGGGIAMNFANIGIPVTIVDRNQEALDRGLAVVRKNYERTAKKGRLRAEDVETRMALITGSTDRKDFADADIVIEAVFEDMDLKKSVFMDFDEICKPDCILASNTSALDLNEIAAVTKRPESVIGTHFFSPANVMRLVEVVRGEKTSDEVIATTMALSKKIKKLPVLAGVCYGFIGNRMLAPRGFEADQLILEGASPAQVDKVLFDFGFPMGNFAMYDMAGLDIGWSEETSGGESVRDLLCESGRRGQKNGRGYYTYDPETRTPSPDPEVEQIIRDFAASKQIQQRQISDEEILERCLYPMVNEGAKILEEGIAQRGGDIDVVWVNGYGWPVYRGGPMFWGDLQGLGKVKAAIERYHNRLGGDHWTLSPLLSQLADEGGRLQEVAAARPQA